jgi:hypothetical protein
MVLIGSPRWTGFGRKQVREGEAPAEPTLQPGRFYLFTARQEPRPPIFFNGLRRAP